MKLKNCIFHEMFILTTLGRETLGVTTKLFAVICHMILIGSHFSEADRGGDRIQKCTESPHLVKLEYAVPPVEM